MLSVDTLRMDKTQMHFATERVNGSAKTACGSVVVADRAMDVNHGFYVDCPACKVAYQAAREAMWLQRVMSEPV